MIDRSVFVWYDPDLDAWLGDQLPAVAAGTATTYEPAEDGLTFRKMAQAVLGEITDDLTTLAKLIIERGKTFSPKQVKEIVTRFEHGDIAAALRSDGYANLFFVHDGKNRVFVLSAFQLSDSWYVNVRRLGNVCTWGAGCRLLVRN